MNFTDAGWDLLKKREGLRLHAYPDSGGKLTIGYGHTNGVREGDAITREKADLFLLLDLDEASRCVNTHVHVPLNPNQFSALVIFTFNVGCNAFTNSTLVRVLNAGDYHFVPNQLRRWVYDNGVIVRGLVHRRDEEIQLWKKEV